MSIARRRRFRKADFPFGMSQNATKCYHLLAPHYAAFHVMSFGIKCLRAVAIQVAPQTTEKRQQMSVRHRLDYVTAPDQEIVGRRATSLRSERRSSLVKQLADQ